MNNSSKIYFKNLNGLRFIAAFFVIIHHIEQFKSIFKIPNLYESNAFVQVIGKLGVVLFFVLSGFLITYLLLAEEKSFQKINIKQFYIRRILRIWPLYFLIIIISLGILPFINIFEIPGYNKSFIFENLSAKIILFILFFPNLLLSMYGVIPYASQTWSIGTEEQFYLIWPNLIKLIKRYRIVLMVTIIFLYMIIRFLLKNEYFGNAPNLSLFYEFWKYFNIDCMAIGAIFAILLFNKSSLLKLIMNRYLFYFTIVILFFLLFNGIHIAHIHNEFYATLFGIIILNFSANSKINLSLENRVFNFLGRISYGLYMYHAIAIVFVIKIALSFDIKNNWFIYTFSLLLTIIISYISFEYFEKIFLKFKIKYTKIISGNEAKK